MNVLKLTLKKKWFDLIKDGIKTEEYREIKPYWIKRLIGNLNEMENDIYSEFVSDLKRSTKDYYKGLLDFYECFFNQYESIEFTNGYNPKSPQITMECLGIEIGKGKVEWGAAEGEQYFVIKLGGEISRNNC